jgi:hypothetical protein
VSSQRHLIWHGLFVISEWRWRMIIDFVHIGGIVVYHCLNFLFILIVNLIRTLWSNAYYIHLYTVINSFCEKGFPRAISYLSIFVKVTLLTST